MTDKKRKGRQRGSLAASKQMDTVQIYLPVYHRSGQNVKPFFADLAQQAQRYAANARESWRSAIHRQDGSAGRRFFCQAMKHQAIADHLAAEMRRYD